MQGCLEAAVLDAAPTQERLEQLDLATESVCQWCHQARGTPMHRAWCCDGTRALRDLHGHESELLRAAAEAHEDADARALFSRALYPDLRTRAPPPTYREIIRWAGVGTIGTFSGSVYLDGSAFQPEDSVLCRAGWAVVQISPDGSMLQECYGNLPTLVQDSGAGELWSFLMALRFSAPPLRVVTDYKRLLDGIAAGRDACTAASMQHADIWRAIWDAAEDFGLEHVTLVKIRSHTSLARVRDGSAGCTWTDWAGNRAADSSAKKGAAIHPAAPGLKEAIQNGRILITGIARWLGTVGAYLVELDSPDVQPKVATRAIRAYGDYVAPQSMLLVDIPSEEDGQSSGEWRPRVLHCEARLAERERKQRDCEAARGHGRHEPCAGSAARASRTAGSMADVHQSHSLCKVGPYVFCYACGAHSSVRRSARLRAACQRPQRHDSIGQRKRLRDGRHPITGDRLGEVEPYRP